MHTSLSRGLIFASIFLISTSSFGLCHAAAPAPTAPAAVATTTVPPAPPAQATQETPPGLTQTAPAPTTTHAAVVQPMGNTVPQTLPEANAKLDRLYEGIRRCANLQELSIRLKCYDDYAIDLGYITPDRVKADQTKIAKIGVWNVSSKDDNFGNKQMILRTESLNTVTGKLVDRNVGFVIRCTPGQTDAYLDWRAPLLGTSKLSYSVSKLLVNYSLGGESKQAEDWEVSTDSHALFVPDAVTFIRSAMDKKILTINFAPTGAGAETVRFNIEGLGGLVNDVIVKECYGENMTPNKPGAQAKTR